MSSNPFGPAPSLPDVRQGLASLESGQKGDAVARIQLLLGVFDDGVFGSNTKRTVSAFQQRFGIPDDEGKVGAATLSALEEANAPTIASLAKIDPRNKTLRTHPELRKRLGQLAEVLAGRGMQALISDGFRTFAEQDAIFARGRTKPGDIVTNARGGQSNHNYGLAVDMYPVIDGTVFVDIPKKGASASFKQRFKGTQQAVIDDSENLGLFSGSHFTRVDMPHVQLLAEDVLKPAKCLEIFNAHHKDFDAVWAEATKLFRD